MKIVFWSVFSLRKKSSHQQFFSSYSVHFTSTLNTVRTPTIFFFFFDIITKIIGNFDYYYFVPMTVGFYFYKFFWPLFQPTFGGVWLLKHHFLLLLHFIFCRRFSAASEHPFINSNRLQQCVCLFSRLAVFALTTTLSSSSSSDHSSFSFFSSLPFPLKSNRRWRCSIDWIDRRRRPRIKKRPLLFFSLSISSDSCSCRRAHCQRTLLSSFSSMICRSR